VRFVLSFQKKKKKKKTMPLVKIVKNRPYFKRFQVKYRRRREGKTDYGRRTHLVSQDKNKYNSPKYRFVVRFTNKDIICQIVFSQIVGDKVLCAAYAHELPSYGLSVGLTNYAAAYCTGLLCARRLLKKLKLDAKYVGQEKVDGEDFYVTALEGDEPNPFFCLLDVGLARCSTGAKVFSAMKGGCDGGLEIPHSETRFVGYDTEAKKLNAADLRGHIFGAHVGSYMKSMKENDEEAYKKHFSQYIKLGLAADGLEALYTKVHKAIRASPDAVLTKKKKPEGKNVKNFKKSKLSLEQRKANVKQKKAKQAQKLASAE